ncbi:hypothetical protein QP713_09125 [Neisseria mucosa]|uniref:Uncharacterized protein n=1 Tax=Neisseria mucosa TaxID=488 RepID=A0AAW6ZG94_NEIMU|nr:hypothetical protein [Neisseria mucosa]MDK6726913.1 hypothetical protein [Neisseria mucosa]MDK6871284.1 hypothetical protein [Neisseria mucosa]MDK8110941.1 hypothetical protein [Neisseria mucosa]MDK8362255.1 hypothetical protein [Neisseria mucosa]
MNNIVQISTSTIPLRFLNHRETNIPKDLKQRILYDRFHNTLIADGLQHGFFYFDENMLQARTKLPLPTLKGFVFEVFAVRYFNENLTTIGKKAFNWCTNRQRSSSDSYIQSYTAIGTGFVETKQKYSYSFYEPHGNADIRFIRKNKESDNGWEFALEMNSNNPASIQIKAITSNEITEIINPLLCNKYTHVLTFLRDSYGIHSYTRCMEQVGRLFKTGQITQKQRLFLEDRIYSPEHLGIYQYDVDDYSEYLNYWYKGRGNANDDLINAIGIEVAGYTANESGILIPNNI